MKTERTVADMNAILFFTGYRKVLVKPEYGAALLDICLRYSIAYANFACNTEGEISFLVSAYTAKKLRRLCEEEGIKAVFSHMKGIPSFFWRYRRRVGLAVGMLFAIAMLFFSSRFVWDIRVTGNTDMTETQVREELRACGFGIGSYIPNFHASELENRVLLASDRIAWISVYLDGTVATVQIIERVEAPPEEDLSHPANLIAACDGQIETLELYRGNCIVKKGQAVKKGELLVSGVYDSNTVGYRYTRAAGHVFARTERNFTVEIPLSVEEKSYQSEKCTEIVLNFFDFSIKIFKNTGNTDMTCDIIKEEKGLELFGIHALPICFTITKQLAYTQVPVTRTHEQAIELAYLQLNREMASLSNNVQLLSKTVSTQITPTSLILECTLSCIEDIAVQTEFDFSEQP